jgi:chromosome segregation ATPase
MLRVSSVATIAVPTSLPTGPCVRWVVEVYAQDPFRWLEQLLEQVPEHARRINRLEDQMADITQAEADLAAEVEATAAHEAEQDKHIADLDVQLAALQSAAGSAPPEVQAIADNIEASLTKLKASRAAAAAAPTTAPADVPPPA